MGGRDFGPLEIMLQGISLQILQPTAEIEVHQGLVPAMCLYGLGPLSRVWIRIVPSEAIDQWVEEGIGIDVGDDTNQESHQRSRSVRIYGSDSQLPDDVIGVFTFGSVELVSHWQEVGCFTWFRDVEEGVMKDRTQPQAAMIGRHRIA